MRRMIQKVTAITLIALAMAISTPAQDTELGKAKIGTQESSVTKETQTLHIISMVTGSREGGTYRTIIKVRFDGDATTLTIFEAAAVLAPNASESYTTSFVVPGKAPTGTARLEISLYFEAGFGNLLLAARAETTVDIVD